MKVLTRNLEQHYSMDIIGKGVATCMDDPCQRLAVVTTIKEDAPNALLCESHFYVDKHSNGWSGGIIDTMKVGGIGKGVSVDSFDWVGKSL